MGQFFLICNIDKKECLYSPTFGDGPKLCQFGYSAGRMLSGLTLLLADGNGYGGLDGDHPSERPVVGSWAGDRIVIAGDYADNGKFVPEENQDVNLYRYADQHYTDISETVLNALLDDEWLAPELAKNIKPFILKNLSQETQDRLTSLREKSK